MTVRKLTEQEIDDIWYKIETRAAEPLNEEYARKATAYIEHHGYSMVCWRWSDRHGYPWKYDVVKVWTERQGWWIFSRDVVVNQSVYGIGLPMATNETACYMWAADKVRQLKGLKDKLTDSRTALTWIGPDYT